MERSFVGETREVTNLASAFLMDLAGNPYGTYQQDEPCIHCGGAITAPQERTFASRLFSKSGHLLQEAQRRVSGTRPNWIHLLMTHAS